MANKYLTGADFNAAGSYEGGTKPVATDDVIVPSTNQNDIISTGALNVQLGSVKVHKGFSRAFGANGAGIPIAANKIEVWGSTGCYIDCDKLGAAGVIPEIIVGMQRPEYICSLGGQAGDAGDWTTMRFFRGTVIVGTSVEFASGSIIQTGYVANALTDLTLTVEVMTDTLATYRQNGGTCTLKAHTTLADIMAGICTKDLEEVDLINVYNGARLFYDHESADADNVDIVVFSGGECDITRNARVKVIDSVTVHPAGILRKLNTVTVTAPNYMPGSIVDG